MIPRSLAVFMLDCMPPFPFPLTRFLCFMSGFTIFLTIFVVFNNLISDFNQVLMVKEFPIKLKPVEFALLDHSFIDALSVIESLIGDIAGVAVN